MFEELVKDISNDYFDNINSLMECYEKTKPKIIKRKIYVRKKRKYRKMIQVNLMHDIIGNSLRMNSLALRILKNRFNKTQ